MIIKSYKLSDIHNYLNDKNGFKKKFKIKMKFRKSFEYLYLNKDFSLEMDENCISILITNYNKGMYLD